MMKIYSSNAVGRIYVTEYLISLVCRALITLKDTDFCMI